MYRHHPQHARVRELLAEGAIGEAVLRCGRRSPSPWPPSAGRAATCGVQPALDGGAFMDVGCYALNAARFLFDAEPIEVTAIQRLDPAFGVDTLLAAVLRFPGDRLALIDGSFDANGPAALRDQRLRSAPSSSSRRSSPRRRPLRFRSCGAASRLPRRSPATNQYGQRGGSLRAERSGGAAAGAGRGRPRAGTGARSDLPECGDRAGRAPFMTFR